MQLHNYQIVIGRNTLIFMVIIIGLNFIET